jgi:hypothetical protein
VKSGGPPRRLPAPRTSTAGCSSLSRMGAQLFSNSAWAAVLGLPSTTTSCRVRPVSAQKRGAALKLRLGLTRGEGLILLPGISPILVVPIACSLSAPRRIRVAPTREQPRGL